MQTLQLVKYAIPITAYFTDRKTETHEYWLLV